MESTVVPAREGRAVEVGQGRRLLGRHLAAREDDLRRPAQG